MTISNRRIGTIYHESTFGVPSNARVSDQGRSSSRQADDVSQDTVRVSRLTQIVDSLLPQGEPVKIEGDPDVVAPDWFTVDEPQVWYRDSDEQEAGSQVHSSTAPAAISPREQRVRPPLGAMRSGRIIPVGTELPAVSEAREVSGGIVDDAMAFLPDADEGIRHLPPEVPPSVTPTPSTGQPVRRASVMPPRSPEGQDNPPEPEDHEEKTHEVPDSSANFAPPADDFDPDGLPESFLPVDVTVVAIEDLPPAIVPDDRPRQFAASNDMPVHIVPGRAASAQDDHGYHPESFDEVAGEVPSDAMEFPASYSPQPVPDDEYSPQPVPDDEYSPIYGALRSGETVAMLDESQPAELVTENHESLLPMQPSRPSALGEPPAARPSVLGGGDVNQANETNWAPRQTPQTTAGAQSEDADDLAAMAIDDGYLPPIITPSSEAKAMRPVRQNSGPVARVLANDPSRMTSPPSADLSLPEPDLEPEPVSVPVVEVAGTVVTEAFVQRVAEARTSGPRAPRVAPVVTSIDSLGPEGLSGSVETSGFDTASGALQDNDQISDLTDTADRDERMTRRQARILGETEGDHAPPASPVESAKPVEAAERSDSIDPNADELLSSAPIPALTRKLVLGASPFTEQPDPVETLEPVKPSPLDTVTRPLVLRPKGTEPKTTSRGISLRPSDVPELRTPSPRPQPATPPSAPVGPDGRPLGRRAARLAEAQD